MSPGENYKTLCLDNEQDIDIAERVGIQGVESPPHELSVEETDLLISAVLAKGNYTVAQQLRVLSWNGGNGEDLGSIMYASQTDRHVRVAQKA